MDNWRILARCRPVDGPNGEKLYQTSRFYPEQGENAVVAKSLCNVCPVRKLCLAEALLNREHQGVWGGTSKNERKVMVGILDAASLRPDLSHSAPALATSDERDTEFAFVIAV